MCVPVIEISVPLTRLSLGGRILITGDVSWIDRPVMAHPCLIRCVIARLALSTLFLKAVL